MYCVYPNLNLHYWLTLLGKTLFAMGLAYAVACGSSFIKWSAPEPKSVLFIDGEMPLSLMQERMQEIVKSFGTGIATLLGGIRAWLGINNK